MANIDTPDQLGRGKRIYKSCQTFVAALDTRIRKPISGLFAKFDLKIHKLHEEEKFDKLFIGLKSLGEKKVALKPRFDEVVQEYVDRSYKLWHILPILIIFGIVLLSLLQTAWSYLSTASTSKPTISFDPIQVVIILLLYFFFGYLGHKAFQISFERSFNNSWAFWGTVILSEFVVLILAANSPWLPQSWYITLVSTGMAAIILSAYGGIVLTVMEGAMYLAVALTRKNYSHRQLTIRLIQLLSEVEASENIWNNLEARLKVTRKLEEIAQIVEFYLSAFLRTGDSDTDNWVAQNVMDIAARYRNWKKKILASTDTTRNEFIEQLVSDIENILFDNWIQLGRPIRANNQEEKGLQQSITASDKAAMRNGHGRYWWLINFVRGLVAPILILLGFYIVQAFSPFQPPTGDIVRAIVLTWFGISLITSFDPNYQEKVGLMKSLKDIWGGN